MKYYVKFNYIFDRGFEEYTEVKIVSWYIPDYSPIVPNPEPCAWVEYHCPIFDKVVLRSVTCFGIVREWGV